MDFNEYYQNREEEKKNFGVRGQEDDEMNYGDEEDDNEEDESDDEEVDDDESDDQEEYDEEEPNALQRPYNEKR